MLKSLINLKRELKLKYLVTNDEQYLDEMFVVIMEIKRLNGRA